jgi:hypothetical protein
MKVSQAVPFGAKAMLYHPELFNSHEEVIIYERNEFRRTFNSIRNNIKDIILKDHQLKEQESCRVMGQWFWTMDRIHIINSTLDSFFTETPCQSYLDAYIPSPVVTVEEEVAESLMFAGEKVMSLELL